MPGTRKLGRATANRTAMLRAMVTFLLENGKIETTVTRAKEVKAMTEKTVHEIFTKNDYTDASVLKTVVAIRQYNKRLGFSESWVSNFVYQVVMLAKKEPKQAEQ